MTTTFEGRIDGFIRDMSSPGDDDHWREALREARRALVTIGESNLEKIRLSFSRLNLPAVGVGAATDRAHATIGQTFAVLARQTRRDVVLAIMIQYVIGLPIRESLVLDTAIWQARWAEYAFPTVAVSGVQAAALALSDVAEEDLATLRFPWPAFAIRLPAGEFPVVLSEDPPPGCPDYQHGRSHIRFIHALGYAGPRPPCELDRDVARADGAFFLQGSVPVGEYEVQLHSGVRRGPELWTMVDVEGMAEERSRVAIATSELESRAIAMMARLTINVAIALEQHGKRRKHHSDRPRATLSGLFLPGDFALGTPVKVDAREHLAAYLVGAGRQRTAHKVRWVVRGHWRQQAWGAERAERRRTWIQPHYAGHRQGATLVREHAIR